LNKLLLGHRVAVESNHDSDCSSDDGYCYSDAVDNNDDVDDDESDHDDNHIADVILYSDDHDILMM